MTIINLLNLFFQNRSKNMINSIGYEFDNISLEINNSYFQMEFPEYETLSKSKYFKEFLTESLYSDLLDIFEVYSTPSRIGKKFINSILIINLNISNRSGLEYFLKKIFSEVPNKDTFIKLLENTLKDIRLHITEDKMIFKKQAYTFLKHLLENEENILKTKGLITKNGLDEIVKNGELRDLLKYVKVLTAKNIVDFQINLKKDAQEVNFLRLSSGEKTLLSYFANITARVNELIEIKKLDNTYKDLKNQTFLILIDEVELHLHPEWQRKFIKQLNDFFQYKNKLIRFQFIIATHSPFVVSDMFEDNILYLGDRGTLETKTFGGNIFDIFKDDFYVSNTIGAFSEQIIHELSEFLYFIFIVAKARRDENFFMLRDFFDLMYELTDKDEENKQLLSDLDKFLSGDNDENFEKKISRVLKNQYLKIYLENRESFLKKAKIIIDNIGEEVVNQHLKNMYYYVKDEE